MRISGQQSMERLSGFLGLEKTTVFLVIPFLLEAGFVLFSLCSFILLKNDTTFPESSHLLSFVSAASTGHVFQDPFAPPYNPQVYGPLFYVVGSAVAYLCRSHLYETAVVMRLISLLSVLVTAGVVMWIVQRLYRSRSLGFFAAILALACPWLFVWGATARPDTLAILLAMLALGIHINRGRNPRVALMVGIVLGLSVLTKQSMSGMAAAILADSLFAGEWLYVATIVVGGAVPLLLLLACVHERSLMLQNVMIASHAYLDYTSLPHSLLVYAWFSKEAIVLLVLAMTGIPGALRQREFRPVFLAMVIAGGSSVFALVNIASSYNYLILPWMLLILLVPEGLRTLSGSASAVRFAVPVLSLAALLIIFHERSALIHRPTKNLDATGLKEIRLFSNLPYLEARSKQPLLLDPLLYHVLEMKHVLSLSPISDEVNQEQFDLVILQGAPAPDEKNFVVANLVEVSEYGRPLISDLNAHYGAFLLCGDALVLKPRHREPPQVEDYAAFLDGKCSPSSDALSVYTDAQ